MLLPEEEYACLATSVRRRFLIPLVYRARVGGMRIVVSVKPGSKVESVDSTPGGLIVRVRARALEGQANIACVRALAEHFGVPISRVTLVRGARSRQKLFEIDD